MKMSESKYCKDLEKVSDKLAKAVNLIRHTEFRDTTIGKEILEALDHYERFVSTDDL